MKIKIAVPCGWHRVRPGCVIRISDRWIDLTDVRIGCDWFTADDPDLDCNMVGTPFGPGEVYYGVGNRVPGAPMIVIRRNRR